MKQSYRDVLREIAYDNHGYVTVADAAEAGVPAIELPKLAARGGLEHYGYRLYRVTDIPPTEHDQFAEATLRAGGDSHLRGESVLALLGLGDVNPRKITVGTHQRIRRALPSYINLIRVPEGTKVSNYHGIRSQPVADAILECRGRIPASRLCDAAAQARAEGLLTTSEWRHVRKELSP